MSKRKNRLASDPMDSPDAQTLASTPEKIPQVEPAQDHAPEPVGVAIATLPGVVAIDAPSISMGSLERFVASDEIEKIDAQALVPSEAQIVALADFSGSGDTLEQAPPPRFRLQIEEQVEALGLVLRSVDLDRGASIRAATCAISALDGDCLEIVARSSATSADAAIAQALETLRWLVEPA